MPVHDWTRVTAGDFHQFRRLWADELRAQLNGGLLPRGYTADVQDVTGPPEPDVVIWPAGQPSGGAKSVKDEPPTASIISRAEYAWHINQPLRVVVRDDQGTVAVVEIVFPENKRSPQVVQAFVERTVEILNRGVSFVLIDLYPPKHNDPGGLAAVVWDDLGGVWESIGDKPLTAASFVPGDELTAYFEPLTVGDTLPSLPIFLSEDYYVPAPLESSYMASWAVYPTLLKEIVEPPAGR